MSVSTLDQVDFSLLEALNFNPPCSMGKPSGEDIIMCENEAVWYVHLIQPCCEKIAYCCNYHKEQMIEEWESEKNFKCTTCKYVHTSSWKKIVIGNFIRI